VKGQQRLPGDVGATAEQAALEFLMRHGLSLVAQNYRTKAGEIDLIMRDGNVLVFVEVRYRSRDDYGAPEETIAAPKRRKITRAAAHYLTTLLEVPDCRFDVITLLGDSPARHDCEWLQGAFDTSDSVWRG
jgi:putative endonuclease